MVKIDIDPFVSAFVDSALKSMQGLVRKGEEVAPQVILFAWENGAPAILPLIGVGGYFQSKQAKRLLRPMVKKTWGQISADKPFLKLSAVLVLSDAWVENVAIEEGLRMIREGRDTPFAPKPGMAEALMIVVSTLNGEWQYQWPYVRGKDQVVFTAQPTVEKSPEGPRALLMGLWPL